MTRNRPTVQSLVSGKYRFVGGPHQSHAHVTTLDEVVKWLNSIPGDYDTKVVAVCGWDFRPQWSGVMLLDTDDLCPFCIQKLRDEQEAHESKTPPSV